MRKGFTDMLYHELERYAEVVEKLKDDREKLKDTVLMRNLFNLTMTPDEEKDNEYGINLLILNAIRKHRGLPYPA